MLEPARALRAEDFHDVADNVDRGLEVETKVSSAGPQFGAADR